MPPAGRADALLERESEMALLRDAVAAAGRGAGSVVVVAGPAGIGKTRLLAEARDAASATGFTVLSGSGGELERDYPFGVVRQLFEPALRAGGPGAGWLDGPASAAEAVFAPPTDSSIGDAGDVSFAVLHGLYWLVVNAAATRPVLLVVDDLHWCDPPSLRFLTHLAPRLDGLPVLLAVGMRPAEPGTDTKLVAAVEGSGAALSIRPGPLSGPAVARLIDAHLGMEPEPEFTSACENATGGNPLLVTELLRAMHAEHIRPDTAHITTIATRGPSIVARTVLLRLLHLPPGAIEVARAVAILADGAEPAAVSALTGLDQPLLAGAVDALLHAEILRQGPPLAFVHPLIRDAIYHELSPGERQRRHAQAARVLIAGGAASAQVATQLLALAPQRRAWVVDVLRDAARVAVRAGAADSAVTYLRRALREAPEPGPGNGLSRQTRTSGPGSDPLRGAPASGLRGELLRELGAVEGLVDAPAAVEHLSAAYAALRDPDARMRTADLLARLLMFTGPAGDAAAIARRGAAEAPPECVDEYHALRALELYAPHFGAPDADTAGQLARALAGLDDTGPGSRSLLAVAAWGRALAGASAPECVTLVQRALGGGVLIHADPALMSLVAVSVLILADRDEAVPTCEALLDSAHRRGSLFAIAGIHQCQGWNWLARGELAEAESCLRQAVVDADTLHESTWNAGTPYVAAFLALVLIERGDLVGARHAIATSGDPAAGADADTLCGRARIEVLLAERRYGQAVAETDRYAGHAGRIVNPGWAPWRSLKARALMHLGQVDAAVALLEAELVPAQTWGAPGTVGPALRRLGAALVRPDGSVPRNSSGTARWHPRGADGEALEPTRDRMQDTARGLELLHRAVEATEGSPATLEHAKSLCALGIALRQTRRSADARTPLRRAFDLATRCAAVPLAERARAELSAAGGRPRALPRAGPAALTPSERRVADLAAAGRSNRDIARTLYVTPKTVEVHLSSTYRKLGITGRTELADVLAGALGAVATIDRQEGSGTSDRA